MSTYQTKKHIHICVYVSLQIRDIDTWTLLILWMNWEAIPADESPIAFMSLLVV